MTDDQLESVIADTGIERFRWLTSDANPDETSREGYRRLVREKAEALDGSGATAAPVDPPAPNPHAVLLKLVRDCPHAGPASCGCNAVRRCAIYNRDVAIEQCLRCVRDGGLEG